MKRVFVFLTLASVSASATAQTHEWTQPGHPPLYQAPTLDTIHRDDTARRAREGEADLARMRAEDARQVQATQVTSDTARLSLSTDLLILAQRCDAARAAAREAGDDAAVSEIDRRCVERDPAGLRTP